MRICVLFALVAAMKKDELLKDLTLYKEAIAYIDSKVLILEHTDDEIKKTNNELKKIKSRLSGKNFIILWTAASVLLILPMAILNYLLQVTFNFIFLAPVIGFLSLYLYKMKYQKTQQKIQIKALEGVLSEKIKENKDIVGEINYSKTIADELLGQLLLTREKKDITTCETDLANVYVLEFIYAYIMQNEVTTFAKGFDYFNAVKNKLSKEAPELMEEIKKNEKYVLYRKGVLIRCATQN